MTGFQGLLFLLAYWLKIKLGGTLAMSEVFCGISVLITSHFYVTAGVSETIMLIQNYFYIFKKITKVLNASEPYKVILNEDMHISIKGVVSSWTEEPLREISSEEGEMNDHSGQVLRDVNAHLEKNTLCAVLGPVGSGKSTFLNTIMGECNISEGEVSVCGTIGFASQET